MAVLDILTFEEARQSLDRARDDQGTLLESLITSVSQRIDGFAGPVVQRTVTGEKLTGRGGTFVLLKQRPALSITTVVEDGVTLTASDYDLETGTGQLFRTTTNGHALPWCAGRRRIVVTYEAGRYASTDVVGDVFKDAARITLANLWRMHQDGTVQVDEFDVPRNPFPGFALPNAAMELLGAERRAPLVR